MCLADWILGDSDVSQFFALSASEVRACVLTKGVSAAHHPQNFDRASSRSGIDRLMPAEQNKGTQLSIA